MLCRSSPHQPDDIFDVEIQKYDVKKFSMEFVKMYNPPTLLLHSKAVVWPKGKFSSLLLIVLLFIIIIVITLRCASFIIIIHYYLCVLLFQLILLSYYHQYNIPLTCVLMCHRFRQ